MGKVKCEQHGLQPFFEVCEHVYDSFKQEVRIDAFKMPLHILICMDCKDRIKAEELNDFAIEAIMDMSEEEYEKYELKFVEKYNQLSRRVICVKCASEVQCFKIDFE